MRAHFEQSRGKGRLLPPSQNRGHTANPMTSPFDVRKQRVRCAAAVLVALVVAGFLHPAYAEAVREFQAPLEPLAFFVGSWECAGEFTASKKPVAAHLGVSADLEGAWLSLRWDDRAPGQFHALELWGFDAAAKRFVNLIFDNFGGVRRFSSPGWGGSSLVWTAEAASGAVPGERFVFERKTDRQLTVTWQVRKLGADWTTGDQLTCRP
jgi:hypothetical protein